MTKTEAAAYEELGRTPEQIAAKAAELDVKFGTHTNGAAEVTPPRIRKPRSDKGTVKGPKVVAQVPAGKLTKAQAESLQQHISLAFHRREQFSAAEVALRAADVALHDAEYALETFVASLTA